MAAYGIKAAALLESGLHTLAEWSDRMLKEYGEQIRPHLDALWQKAQEHLKTANPENGVRGDANQPSQQASAVEDKSGTSAQGNIPQTEETSQAPEGQPKDQAPVGAPAQPLPPYYQEITFQTLDNLRAQTSKVGSLKPNTRYDFKDQTWVTDEHSRPIYAGGDLIAISHGRVGKSLQTKIGNEGEHANTDVGFHLLGDQFDGPVSRLNVLQGDGVLNNGKFKKLEILLKKHLEAGDKVHVRIHAEYEGSSVRPSDFRVEYQIGGGDIKTKTFPNTPSRQP